METYEKWKEMEGNECVCGCLDERKEIVLHTFLGSLTIHEGGTMRSPCGPSRHISDNLSILKQLSLLWYVDLHQEQERATISLLPKESLDWNDLEHCLHLPF